MWRRLHAVTGPLGRRCVSLLVLCGLWVAWWQWPLAPKSSWAIQGLPSGYPLNIELAADGQLAVVRPTELVSGLSTDRYQSMQPCRTTVRDLATGRVCLDFVPDDPRGTLECIAPDGSWVLTRDERRTLRVLATSNGRELATFPVVVHNEFSVAWSGVPSPDSQTLVLARPPFGRNGPGAIRLWDVAAGRERAVLPRAGFLAIDGFVHAFSPDGRRLAGFESDNPPKPLADRAESAVTRIKVWDLSDGCELAAATLPLLERNALAFSADGRLLVWVSKRWNQTEGRVQVWDWETANAPVTVGTLAAWDHGTVGFAADGRHVYFHGHDGTYAWDSTSPPDSGSQRIRTRVGSQTRMSAWQGPWMRTLIIRYGRTLVLNGKPGVIEVCPVEDMNGPVDCRVRHPDVYQLLMSSDESILAVSCQFESPLQSVLAWLNAKLSLRLEAQDGRSIQVFDARNGAERTLFSVPASTRMLGFSPDGRTLWTETIIEWTPSNPTQEWRIDGWATAPSAWPPIWLLGVTATGVTLVGMDWRRGRRRIATAGGIS